jgi:hypothetical protein
MNYYPGPPVTPPIELEKQEQPADDGLEAEDDQDVDIPPAEAREHPPADEDTTSIMAIIPNDHDRIKVVLCGIAKTPTVPTCMDYVWQSSYLQQHQTPAGSSNTANPLQKRPQMIDICCNMLKYSNVCGCGCMLLGLRPPLLQLLLLPNVHLVPRI